MDKSNQAHQIRRRAFFSSQSESIHVAFRPCESSSLSLSLSVDLSRNNDDDHGIDDTADDVDDDDEAPV